MAAAHTSSFDDLALWRTSLPGVRNAVLPPATDRPNPRLGNGILFASVFAPGCVYALDPATGEIYWPRELPYLGDSCVELTKDLVLAKTAQSLYGLDPASGSIRWEFCPYGPEGETLYSQPVLHGGRVFIGDRRGWLHCLSAVTGETIWKQSASDGPMCNVNATAVVVAGLVVTATNAGFALAYTVSDGRPVWQAKLDGPSIHHLFLVGKHVVAVAESLYFLDPLNGELRGRLNWPGFEVAFAAGTPSNVALFTRSLLAGWESADPVEPESETIFLFEETRLLREMRCSSYIQGIRYSDATGLLYTSGLRGLDILNPQTGEWQHMLQSADMTCLPDVSENRIYAIDGNGVVYALQHPASHTVITTR